MPRGDPKLGVAKVKCVFKSTYCQPIRDTYSTSNSYRNPFPKLVTGGDDSHRKETVLSLCQKLLFLKGQQRETFLLWLSSVVPNWAPVTIPKFSWILFRIHRVIQNRNSFWAMGQCGEPNFLQLQENLKVEWYSPGYYCLCTFTFYHHCPFKGYGKLLKNCCVLRLSGNWFSANSPSA